MRVFKLFFESVLTQPDRWILWTPVPLAAGIGVYFSLPFEPWAYLWAALSALLIAFAVPLRQHRGLLLFLWLPVFLAVLGFAAAQVRAERVGAPVLLKKARAPLVVTGRVIDADPLEKSYRITLDRLSFTGASLPQDPMPARARLRLKKNDTAVPEEGATVRLKAMLTPLPPPVLPGAYDFQRQLYFRGIGATGFALSDMDVVRPRDSGFFFEALRRAIREKVYAANLAPKNIAGLTVAFITGDTGGITEKDWDTARQSGIAHLIAISGSHFVMIVGVLFFMVRAALAAVPSLALRWPIKKIAAGAGMFAAVFYVLLIGAPVSALRAAVMSCAAMLAIMLDRDPFSLRLCALAAFAVLLFEPESLVGAGFQMSFAAVTGLIAFFESTRDGWSRLYHEAGVARRVGIVFLTCFMTTLVASVAVAPYTAYHFLRVPLVSGLIANMVAVPVSSFMTFPLGLLACLLMPLGLEKGPLWAMERSIETLMRAAEEVLRWPQLVFHADAWPMAGLALITLGGLWICLWQGRVRWLGIMPMIVAGVLIVRTERPDVLVGGNFKLLAAVRDEKGVLWLSPGRADKFIREVWREREGSAGTETWPEEGRAGDFLFCGPHACVYTMKGHTVLFVKDEAAATREECAAADIVVTPKAKRPPFFCKARVIDKWALYDEGTHVVFLEPGESAAALTVNHWRGKRPWTGRWYGKRGREEK